MVKRITLAAVLVFGLLAASPVAITSAQNNNPNKVTICHRTNSAQNPYRQITVSHSAVDGQGNNDHSHHTGPVFNPAVHNQQNRGWGDIIPPVEGVTAGLNWNAEGQAIYNNGCRPVTENGNGNGNGEEEEENGVTLGEQVEAPVGAVKAGSGGVGSSSPLVAAGLVGSLAALGYGLLRLRSTDQ